MIRLMRRRLAPRTLAIVSAMLATVAMACDTQDSSTRTASTSEVSIADEALAVQVEELAKIEVPEDYDLSNTDVLSSVSFERKLRMTLALSKMRPEEMVQHVMNRLAYGGNAESFRAGSRLLKYNAAGSVDGAATKDAIASFVARALNRRAKTTGVARQELEKLYPETKFTYAQIIKRQRALSMAIREATTPAQEQEARQSSTDFLQRIRRAAEAEQLVNVVLDDSPLIWTLTDFWFNHLNVSADKVPYDIRQYRDALVHNLFGTYNQMLMASAKNPAMLIYLDNAQNRVLKRANGTVDLFLNENYAREILELHTIGRGPRTGSYASPYTQADVEAVTRLLTGWGIITDDDGRRFFFNPQKHMDGKHVVMGRTFDSGQKGIVNFVQFIANHPATARNLSRKLIHHFVREDLSSPAALALQARLVAIYEATSGSLLSVYEELFSSPEFWDTAVFRGKVKRPLAFAASVLRATGYDRVSLTKPVVESTLNTVAGMGQRLLFCSPPTGYPDDSAHWATSANVIASLRFAFAHAGYHGRSRSLYQTFESTARQFQSQPAGMAVYALEGVSNVYDLSPMSLRFEMSSAQLDVNGGLAAAAKTPDQLRSNKAIFPVRSALGAFLGSPEFLKN